MEHKRCNSGWTSLRSLPSPDFTRVVLGPPHMFDAEPQIKNLGLRHRWSPLTREAIDCELKQMGPETTSQAAYAIYEYRQKYHILGDADGDWYEAERFMRSR